VHNALWEPIDFDGLRLMLRPSPARLTEKLHTKYHPGISRAAHQQMAKRIAAAKARKREYPAEYTIVDVETTGLHPDKDAMLEISAMNVDANGGAMLYTALIQTDAVIPANITELTGITREMLEKEGVPLREAMDGFLRHVGDLPVVAHNAQFDIHFLQAACEKLQTCIYDPMYFDTLEMSRRLLPDLKARKLSDLAAFFGIAMDTRHRSDPDCQITRQVYERLIALDKEERAQRPPSQ